MKTDQPHPLSYQHAAWFLRCLPAAIQAVAEVEAGTMGAFNDDDSPIILFERHYFHRLTSGKFDQSHPHLSDPKAGGYGKNGEQHAKLNEAIALDRNAALMSCSWGLFQIMGANYRRAGYESVQAMVNGAWEDVEEHLRMFVRFVLADAELLDALRGLPVDWLVSAAKFARRYNGPNYRASKYDERIASAFTRLNQEAQR